MIPTSLLRALANPTLSTDFLPRPAQIASPFTIIWDGAVERWMLSDGVVQSSHETLREAETARDDLVRAMERSSLPKLSVVEGE